MASRAIDDSQIVSMHRGGMTPNEIANHFGAHVSSVYRAFYRVNYDPTGENRNRPRRPRRRGSLLPPTWPRQYQPEEGELKTRGPRVDFDAEEAEIARRRIAPRDPCPRCGCRGDIGCKHRGLGPLGWRVG